MSQLLTDQSTKPRIPVVVYVLCFNIMALGTTEFVIAGLLPELADEFSVSIPTAGLFVSGFAVAMAVGAPVLAALTLRLPRRSTLMAAMALFAAGHVLSAMAGTYGVFMASRIVSAVATGAFWAVASVVTVSMVEARIRARALAVLIGGLTVANVAGVPLGTLVGQQLGWRSTFWLLALLAVVGLVSVWRTVPADGAATSSRGVRAELGTFRAPRMWVALATIALFQAAVMGWFSYLAPLLTDVAGMSESWVPAVLTLFGVGSLVGVQLGGRFGDGRPWHTLYGALGALSLGLALVAVSAGNPVLLGVAVLFVGVSAFTAAAPVTSRVLGLAGPAPTLASAATVTAFNVGNTVGPWLGGVTISAGLGYRAPAAMALMLALSALALGVLSRRMDGWRAAEPVEEAADCAPSAPCAAG